LNVLRAARDPSAALVKARAFGMTPEEAQFKLRHYPVGVAVASYCSFAYSVRASFRIGTSGSASFHSAKKS
jgi:hypothetical protein